MPIEAGIVVVARPQYHKNALYLCIAGQARRGVIDHRFAVQRCILLGYLATHTASSPGGGYEGVNFGHRAPIVAQLNQESSEKKYDGTDEGERKFWVTV